jgi:hypothetical protein
VAETLICRVVELIFEPFVGRVILATGGYVLEGTWLLAVTEMDAVPTLPAAS